MPANGEATPHPRIIVWVLTWHEKHGALFARSSLIFWMRRSNSYSLMAEERAAG